MGNTERMVGELITLPLRVGVRVTQLSLRMTEEAASILFRLTTRLLESDDGEQRVAPETRRTDGPAPVTKATTRVPSAEIAPPVLRAQSEPASPGATANAHEPAHVSEEPVLVEEFSEPGAEDGAGAEIHVQEPWKDYRRLGARDVIARLAGASTAELAAVQLYESGHRGRQTILAAVERELRTANGSGSPTQERNR